MCPQNSMIEYIGNWLQSIQYKYNVNPYIFGAIYIASAVPWWYGLYRTIDCLRKKQMGITVRWLVIVGFLTIAPFLYVAVFGRNLPVSFWIIIAAIVVISFINLAKKLQQSLKSNSQK